MKKNIDIYGDGYKTIKNLNDFMLTPAENLVRAMKINRIAPKNFEEALDFGCGEGRHIEFLNSLGYKVFGTDVSDGAVDATTRRLDMKNIKGPEIEKIEPNSKLPFIDNKFDFALCWETIHWVGNKEMFVFYLEEFKRVLKDKGKLIITMPTEHHYLKDFSIEIAESVYQCSAVERQDTVFYAPNLTSLKYMLEERLSFKILQVLSYAYGRTPIENDESKSVSLHNMFSMYAFVLEV